MNQEVSQDINLYKSFIIQNNLEGKQEIEHKYKLSNLSSDVVIYALGELSKGKCQLNAVVDFVFGENK